jgi:1,2-dihydroxy-3-keto-5-methylthiopentene dioxygenase
MESIGTIVKSGFPFFPIHRIWPVWQPTSNRVFHLPDPALDSFLPATGSTYGAELCLRPNAILKYSNISSNANARCDIMATIRVPGRQIHLTEDSAIRQFLGERGVWYEHRPTASLRANAPDNEVLQLHDHWVTPFMEKNGYRTADVIRVTPETPNLPAIRDKFIREHTHSEDEVRFFVEGDGLFWFHKEAPIDEVFAVHCAAGDLLTVPANTKHWFVLGPEPRVCAIRIFTDQAGWVPNYTGSGIDQQYRWL